MTEPFRTVIHISSPDFRISHHTKTMLIGSCFTENIGFRLGRYKFPKDINPAGIQYNPLSAAAVLDRLMECGRFDKSELRHAGGRWFSYLHHGDFSAKDPETCLRHINRRLEEGAAFLKSADLLCLTFGTAWYYVLKESGEAVSNCHKQPQELFDRRFLEPEQIARIYGDLTDRLAAFNPGLRLLFTVSPVRHLRDGAQGSQVSKASLLIGVDRICRDTGACYFPAYEIMMDDLRDYRFYDDDMVHPSRTAAAYIYKRFEETFMDEETRRICREIDPLLKAADHKVKDREHEEYRIFRRKNLDRIDRLERTYPFLSFEEEKRHFDSG